MRLRNLFVKAERLLQKKKRKLMIRTH